MSLNPQELQAVSKVAGDIKGVLDAIKANGVNSPYLDAADNLAAAVQASLASGQFDPRGLLPPLVAELTELQGQITDPTLKAVVTRLASLLGKLLPAPSA